MSPAFCTVTAGATWSAAGGAATSLKVLQPVRPTRARPDRAMPTKHAERLADNGRQWRSDGLIKGLLGSLTGITPGRCATTTCASGGSLLLFGRNPFAHRVVRQSDGRQRIRTSCTLAVPFQDALHMRAVVDNPAIIHAPGPRRSNMLENIYFFGVARVHSHPIAALRVALEFVIAPQPVACPPPASAEHDEAHDDGNGVRFSDHGFTQSFALTMAPPAAAGSAPAGAMMWPYGPTRSAPEEM